MEENENTLQTATENTENSVMPIAEENSGVAPVINSMDIPGDNASICEFCGSKIKIGSRFCPSCGREVKEKNNPNICSFCGGKIGADEKFCPSCGTPNIASAESDSLNSILEYNKNIEKKKEKAPRKKKFVKIISIVVSAVIILSALSYFFIVPEVRYRIAYSQMENGEYRKAVKGFSALKGYRNSAEMVDETRYKNACSNMDNGNYDLAITIFSGLGTYKDSKDKVLECKYLYVVDNDNCEDLTTFDYLKELKAANYKDSSYIYDRIYKWTVKVVVNESEDDTTTNKSSISKYSPVYFHLLVSGGTPGQHLRIRVTGVHPNGETIYRDCSDSPTNNNGSWWFGFQNGVYLNPRYGRPGTLSCTFYNMDTGEFLTSASVYISN